MSNDLERELDNAFTHHPPLPDQITRYGELRHQARQLARLFEKMCPPSEERAIAFAKLREAVMWANAAIAVNETQKERVSPAERGE